MSNTKLKEDGGVTACVMDIKTYQVAVFCCVMSHLLGGTGLFSSFGSRGSCLVCPSRHSQIFKICTSGFAADVL